MVSKSLEKEPRARLIHPQSLSLSHTNSPRHTHIYPDTHALTQMCSHIHPLEYMYAADRPVHTPTHSTHLHTHWSSLTLTLTQVCTHAHSRVHTHIPRRELTIGPQPLFLRFPCLSTQEDGIAPPIVDPLAERQTVTPSAYHPLTRAPLPSIPL